MNTCMNKGTRNDLPNKEIHKDMQIAEAVATHPKVGEIFTSYGLHCVGCHVSPYETIEQGCLIHGMDSDTINKMIEDANISIKKSSDEEVSKHPIKLTEFAVKKLKELRDSKNLGDKGLRVAVLPGGCAGFSYDFSFDIKEPADIVVEQDGFTLFIDKASFEFIKGSTLDYVDSLQGAGLKISNPNARSSCGCGSSFS